MAKKRGGLSKDAEARKRQLANLKPWKKGESPQGGRKAVGASARDWMNWLEHIRADDQELRKIIKNEGGKNSPAKRSAALRLLRMCENPDLADFSDYLSGKVKDVKELREQGIHTDVVKKAKVKLIPTEKGMGEEREIELHDRSGAEFDRVADRTDGKPRQAVDVNANVKMEPVVFEVHGAPQPKD